MTRIEKGCAILGVCSVIGMLLSVGLTFLVVQHQPAAIGLAFSCGVMAGREDDTASLPSFCQPAHVYALQSGYLREAGKGL